MNDSSLITPTPTSPDQLAGTIGWGNWMLAVLRTAPDAHRLLPGVLRLALLRPHQTGSIGLSFQERAARHPDRPALRFEGREWTYAELNTWANRVAHSLKQADIKPGDAVGLLMENRAEMIACALGIVKIGAIVTLLNHNLRGESLSHSLRITGPRVVLVGQECAVAVDSMMGLADAPKDIRWWWDGDRPAPLGWPSLRQACVTAPEHNPPETANIPLHHPCFHIFTSGSTGMPKASVMTHYRWHRCMLGMGMLGLRLRKDDVLYCALPLYHNNAMTVSLGAVIGAGACLALARKFSASGFWQDIRRNGATSFSYIGELCRYLLNQPQKPDDAKHGVRAIIGNGLRPDIWGAFQQRFGVKHIAEFYGASECNLAFINALNMQGSAGVCPLPYAVVNFDVEQESPLRDAKSNFMSKVEKGEVGLLLTEITDKAPMDGYTDAKATNAKIFRDVFKRGDAWFNSGDLVRDQGFKHIQFIDRVGDTFRWKGENVATTEVEAALCAQPGIEEAVVYGVQIPGADGRGGMAALRVQPGLSALADGKALMNGLRQVLPRYATPLFLRVRDEHEITSTFKHRKVDLKREGFTAVAGHDALWVLTPDGYAPLQPAMLQAIQAGNFRFE